MGEVPMNVARIRRVGGTARTRVASAAALAAIPVALLLAQGPSFEVASIKPNNSGDGRVMMQNQPGRFTATNVTLKQLIRNAYQLQDFQISGGPSWISSDHFDIVAKIEASEEQAIASGPGLPGQGPS